MYLLYDINSSTFFLTKVIFGLLIFKEAGLEKCAGTSQHGSWSQFGLNNQLRHLYICSLLQLQHHIQA